MAAGDSPASNASPPRRGRVLPDADIARILTAPALAAGRQAVAVVVERHGPVTIET